MKNLQQKHDKRQETQYNRREGKVYKQGAQFGYSMTT